MKLIKVLIAAGGSGGHLFPAQQLFEKLQSDCEIVFAGHKLSRSSFFAHVRVPFSEIASAPLKRGELLHFFAATWKGFWQSIRLIRLFRPDVVVGFGSYHSFPVLLAATFLRKKIVLFEANCVLGKVNRFFLFAAEKIALQFPLPQPLNKEVFVPYLPWTLSEKKFPSPREGRLYFGLDPNRLTLLVFGGSQGAQFLNEAIPQALAHLKEDNIQVIHFTGKGETAGSYGKFPACIKEFEPAMSLAYAAADIVICRSGAATIAELIRFQKPALLIPFPFAAEDHQKKNGHFLAERIGGARLLLQREASPERIAEEIRSLLRDRETLTLALQRENRQKGIDFGALVRAVGGKR